MKKRKFGVASKKKSNGYVRVSLKEFIKQICELLNKNGLDGNTLTERHYEYIRVGKATWDKTKGKAYGWNAYNISTGIIMREKLGVFFVWTDSESMIPSSRIKNKAFRISKVQLKKEISIGFLPEAMILRLLGAEVERLRAALEPSALAFSVRAMKKDKTV